MVSLWAAGQYNPEQRRRFLAGKLLSNDVACVSSGVKDLVIEVVL
jgi:hypothetical protein